MLTVKKIIKKNSSPINILQKKFLLKEYALFIEKLWPAAAAGNIKVSFIIKKINISIKIHWKAIIWKAEENFAAKAKEKIIIKE